MFGATGRIRFYELGPGASRRPIASRPNAVLAGSGFAAAEALCGPLPRRIDTAYVEFDNSGAAVPAETPTYESAGRAYYEGLSGTRDALRVQLAVPAALSTSAGRTAPAGALGDRVTFYIVATGSTGVRGLEFSAAAGSRVIGVGLACSHPDGAAKDLVVARGYLPEGDQIVKGSLQLGLSWSLSLTAEPPA